MDDPLYIFIYTLYIFIYTFSYSYTQYTYSYTQYTYSYTHYTLKSSRPVQTIQYSAIFAVTPTPTWFEYKIIFLYLKFWMTFCTLLSRAAHILPRLSRASGRHIKQCIDHLKHLKVIEYQRTCHVNPAAAPKYATSCSVLKEELRKLRKVTLYAQHRTKCPNMLIRKSPNSTDFSFVIWYLFW